MREIKFRVFIKWLKITLEVESIDFVKKRVYCKTEIGKPNPCDFYNLGDVVLIQYTNEKDKNDIELYEGDIVKSSKGIGYIDYIESYFRIFRPYVFSTNLCNETNPSTLEPKNNVEKIGSIYENPELLENNK